MPTISFKWIAGGAIVIALLLALGYVKHVIAENDALKQTIAVQAKAAAHVFAVAALNTRIDASATKTAAATQTVYRTINQEVIKYVAVHDHNTCTLDAGWVRLHNAAAAGRIDASASTINASQPTTSPNP